MYRTILGDTWDLIAYKVYGDERAVSSLMQANMQHIDTAIFRAGVELVTPVFELAKTDDDLPPWMR